MDGLFGTARSGGAGEARDADAMGFDFLHGDWLVEHRRLKRRLAGDTTGSSSAGSCRAGPSSEASAMSTTT